MAITDGNGTMVGTPVSRMLTDNRPETKREGPIARAIEEQTSKLPSDLFLWIAGGAILGSLTFKLFGKNGIANFIGEWVPTVLILGLYNKIVKLEGHDSMEHRP